MIRQDWSTLKKLMFMKAAAGGSVIEDTATGNPLTFNTNVAKPIRSLLIPFTPVQSGTGDPSPENVRPIAGWNVVNTLCAGENILNSTAQQSIDVNGQGAMRYGQIFRSEGKYAIVNNSPSDDTLTYKKVKKDLSTYGSPVSVDHGAAKTVTVGDNEMLYVYAQTIDLSDFCVNVGEDKQFHTFTGQSYPVDWTDEAGTVYGGTLDLVTGALSVDRAAETLKWEDGLYSSDLGNYVRKRFPLSHAAVDVAVVPEADLCSVAKQLPQYNNDELHFYVNATQNAAIVFLPEATEDSFTFQVCYHLATPRTIQLDPVTVNALVGDNTIWSDTNGENTVVYLKKA